MLRKCMLRGWQQVLHFYLQAEKHLVPCHSRHRVRFRLLRHDEAYGRAGDEFERRADRRVQQCYSSSACFHFQEEEVPQHPWRRVFMCGGWSLLQECQWQLLSLRRRGRLLRKCMLRGWQQVLHIHLQAEKQLVPCKRRHQVRFWVLRDDEAYGRAGDEFERRADRRVQQRHSSSASFHFQEEEVPQHPWRRVLMRGARSLLR